MVSLYKQLFFKMYIKILVSIYVIYQFGFSYSAVDPSFVRLQYVNHIYKNEAVLKGTTPFCLSDNLEFWAVACRYVFKKLRRDHEKYREMYVHYQSFTDFYANFYKCPKKVVKLNTQYKELQELEKEQFLSFEHGLIEQCLTICLAHPVIVPANTSVQKLQIYNEIAISIVPLDENIYFMIFSKVTEGYTPFDWVKYILAESITGPDLIPKNLLKQDPPTSYSDRINLHSWFHEHYTALFPGTKENIVHTSDAKMFCKLCYVVLRKSQYDVHHIRSDRHRIKPEEQNKVTHVNVLNKTLHYDMPMYVCHTVNHSKTRYLLSHGVDKNSVILYSYMTTDNRKRLLIPIEMVTNLTPEFLDDVEVPARSSHKN